MSTNSLIKQSLRHNILIMKIVGIYPYDNWPNIYKIYAQFFYFFFTVPTPILSVISFIVTKEKDMGKICDNAFLVAQLGILLVKLWPFKNNPEAIKRTVNGLDQKIYNSYRQDQMFIIESTIREYNFIFFGTAFASLASLFTWFGKAFFYEERRFPLEVWLPFEPFEDTMVYVAMLVYLFFSVLSGALDNISLDTLIVGMIFQSAAQVKILKNNLRLLDKRVEHEVDSNVNSNGLSRDDLKAQLVYENICKGIDHYDAIYEYTKEVQSVYSVVVFTQLFASIVVICISCLQLSIVEPFTFPFFGMVTYILTMLLQLFLYCYYGTILYEESDTVSTAIYESEWYNYDQKSKKCLVTFMERTKRPIKQTAGKFFDLSLDTFTKILRRSYSLLAVLKNY